MLKTHQIVKGKYGANPEYQKKSPSKKSKIAEIRKENSDVKRGERRMMNSGNNNIVIPLRRVIQAIRVTKKRQSDVQIL
jgi:hypothetical protein